MRLIIRGAINNIISSDKKDLQNGITAVSAGNHAIAASYVSNIFKLKNKIFLYESANPYRVNVCKNYGANILFNNGQTDKFLSQRIRTNNTHGTGCSLASAITANLFLGKSLKESIKLSIDYVHNGIKNSFLIGKGHNPINHFADFKS